MKLVSISSRSLSKLKIRSSVKLSSFWSYSFLFFPWFTFLFYNSILELKDSPTPRASGIFAGVFSMADGEGPAMASSTDHGFSSSHNEPISQQPVTSRRSTMEKSMFLDVHPTGTATPSTTGHHRAASRHQLVEFDEYFVCPFHPCIQHQLPLLWYFGNILILLGWTA